jgi:hypothetical protein
MRIINHRQFRQPQSRSPKTRRWLRWSLIGLGGLAGLFILANLAMGLWYRGRVLPNYSVAAVPVGNIKFDQLDEKVPVEKLLPASLTLTKDATTQKKTPIELGVTVDWPATRERLKQARSWLPLVSLVRDRSVPAELKLDTKRYDAAIKAIEPDFRKAALPERITFASDNFAITAPEQGYELDASGLKPLIISSLERGKDSLAVPTRTVAAVEGEGKLTGELAALQKKLDAKITYTNAGRTKQLSRADIGRMYETSGQSMQLSSAKMGEVVAETAKGFGMTAANQNEAVQAAYYALTKSQPVTYILSSSSVKSYRYCTAVRGVNTSELFDFRTKLAAVYGDPRGWNNNGTLTLIHAESNCDYTAWLSAPSQMTSFGGLCDSYYSCRSGRNVVINYDRWKGATDPWNAAGGSLEDYRVMVINHETGHWLGFGHSMCSGPGQPAEVMQQQSISLQGCKFNPWPTATELGRLKSSHDLAIHDRKSEYALASSCCSCGRCAG